MTSFVWDAEVIEHALLLVLQSTVIGKFYLILEVLKKNEELPDDQDLGI